MLRGSVITQQPQAKMTAAFATPCAALKTSTFTRSTTPHATRRCVAAATRRAVRMLGEMPLPETPLAEATEPAEIEVPDAAEFEVPETSEQGEDADVPVCAPPQFVVNAQNLAAVREKFRLHESDSGSPEFQIATLTTRIAYLTTHLKEHPKDHACTRGLLKLVATRRRLLKYLKGQDVERFNNIVSGLGIRISAQLREL